LLTRNKLSLGLRNREGANLECTIVNPYAIYRPPLILPNSTTCGVIKQFLQGKLPAVPNVSFGVIDVRDVASLHMLTATKPEAAGQRYSCLAGKSVTLTEIGRYAQGWSGSEGFEGADEDNAEFHSQDTVLYHDPVSAHHARFKEAEGILEQEGKST
jgi:nucleoside-diphosphate-sugar epimerase